MDSWDPRVDALIRTSRERAERSLRVALGAAERVALVNAKLAMAPGHERSAGERSDEAHAEIAQLQKVPTRLGH